MRSCLVSLSWMFAVLLLPGGTISAAPAEGTQALNTRNVSFRSLGQTKAMELRGVQSSNQIAFGGRLDELVKKAQLNLHYAISPALRRDWSHLNIRLNDRLVATVSFPEEGDTANLRQVVDLPPLLFSDYNKLSFELIAHYTDRCEFVGHSSLWASIAPDSFLTLQLAPLTPAPRLELLPAPFFDARDNRDLRIALVLADQQPDTLHAAGMLASWLGSHARYRKLSFDLHSEIPKDRHSIVLGNHVPSLEQLDYQPPAEPSLAILAHPQAPAQRVLLLHGGEQAQTGQAVLALIYGQALLSGEQIRLQQTINPPARQAYDAPAWVPTDRPVRLGELANDPLELETRGNSPAPIELQFRLPPDLFPGFGNSARLDLNYRYTPPTQRDNSRLSVHVNDRFVQAWRLLADEDDPGARRFYLPLFERDFFAATSSGRVPAFQIGASNRISFAFNLDHHYIDPCSDMPSGSVYSSVDEDSTIDFSHFPRYLELPDLAAFANSGYPFTRYADLGDTAILLSQQPSTEEIKTYLYLLGRMGRLSGAAATRFALGTLQQPPSDPRHWLVLGQDAAEADARVTLEAQERVMQRAQAQSLKSGMALPGLHFRGGGQLAALSGFASPQHPGYSAVSVKASSPVAMSLVRQALESAGQRSQIHGALSLIQPQRISSFDLGRDHAIGKLSLKQKIWLWLSRSPTGLAGMGVATGLLLALLLFWMLRAIARRRLQT